jgi:hypothetical protein
MNLRRLSRRTPVHLSEGELQGWLDGEVDVVSTLEWLRHLRRCSHCRSTLALVLHRTSRVAGRLSAVRARYAYSRKPAALANRVDWR